MNVSLTREATNVAAQLRPPSSRPSRLVHGYTEEHTSPNLGYLLQLEPGEQVVSAGQGTITSIIKSFSGFGYSRGNLKGAYVYEITVNHAHGISTVISGLDSLAIHPGNYVSRGEILGSTLQGEIFFGARYNEQWLNPAELNWHFRLEGEFVPAQIGNVGFAPDRVVRNFAGTVVSVLYGGLRYFVDHVRGFTPLLINVDFNGNGTKKGFAALGFTSDDYWNVYAAGAFTWNVNTLGCFFASTQTYALACGGPGRTFSQSPQTWLKDATNTKSTVWLERVAQASGASGSAASWDTLTSSWIGGWNGGIPEENFFSIRGLPAGTYRLCLYADTLWRTPDISTNFYAAVDADMPVGKSTMSITPISDWLEDYNYVRYDLTLATGSVINVKAYGYFDGLQVERLS